RRGHFHAIGAGGRTEDELLAAATECRNALLGLLRPEADHVDDDIVPLIPERAHKCIGIVTVADDCLDLRAKPVFTLVAVIDGHIGAAGPQVRDDAGADEARTTNDKCSHLHTLMPFYRAGQALAGGLPIIVLPPG